MCPGLTSPGARLDVDLEAGTPVVVMAEGKEHALAIGILTMSTKDMYVLSRLSKILENQSTRALVYKPCIISMMDSGKLGHW